MDKTTRTLIICRGLQGSGKSTWARLQALHNPESVMLVSRDEMRAMLFNKDELKDPANEKLITANIHEIIRSGLIRRKTVILHDTNLNVKTIDELINLISEFDGSAQIRIQDFPVSIKECIARDEERRIKGERFVGEKAILATAKKNHIDKDGSLPALPAYVYERIQKNNFITQDNSLPSAWIVDFDGTIAEMGNRNPYDWDKVDEDEPIIAAIELVKNLKAVGHKIIIISGRSEVCRAISEEWLSVYEVPYDMFIMREDDDDRKDNILKKEIITNQILGNYFIAGCLDDRKQVVQEYRAMGLFVAQLSHGMF
jgi:predicted kinase